MKENMKKVMKASVALSMALTVTPTNLYAQEQNVLDETTDTTTLPSENQQTTTEVVEGEPNTTPSKEDTTTVPSETPQQKDPDEGEITQQGNITPEQTTPQNSEEDNIEDDLTTTSLEDDKNLDKSSTGVWQVGNQGFDSLYEAIKASNGDKILLTQDTTTYATSIIDASIFSFQDLVIDLNGFNVSASGGSFLNTKNFDTVKIISSKNQSTITRTFGNAISASGLDKKTSLFLENIKLDGDSEILGLSGNYDVSISSSTITGKSSPVLSFGNETDTGIQHNISLNEVDIKFSGDSSWANSAITVKSNAELNMNNVNIESNATAIRLFGARSNVTINNDTNHTINGSDIIRNTNGMGEVQDNSSLINFNGGEYFGDLENFVQNNNTFVIKGGCFDLSKVDKNIVNKYLLDGLELDEKGNIVTAPEERPFTIEGGVEGTNYTYEDGILTFIEDGNYKIVGDGKQTTDRIVVADTFKGSITINEVNIISNWNPCINVPGTAKLELILEGTNRLQVTTHDFAALQFEKVTTGSLVINSVNGINDKLTAIGWNGAGIGGSMYGAPKNLAIKNGSIEALSNSNGHGIGKGWLSTEDSDISIEGGYIKSTKEIGGTTNSSIKVTGGYLDCGIVGNAVLSGGYITGNISGTVTNNTGQTLTKVEINHGLENVNELFINGLEQKVNNVINGNSISVYLPKGKNNVKVVDTNDIVREFLIDFNNGQPTISVDAVVQIGKVQYKTLKEALENVGENQTIKLVNDVKIENRIDILTDNKYTIDLNGFNIDNYCQGNIALNFQKGNITITNTKEVGSINLYSNYHTIVCRKDAILNLEKVKVIGHIDVGDSIPFIQSSGKINVNEGTDIYTYGPGIYVKESQSTLTMEGGKIKSINSAAVMGNGIPQNAGTIINISGGTLVSEKGFAVYLPQIDGVTNITGGNITGKTGIEIRAGELNVSGNVKIASDADYFISEENENGQTTTGAGIAVVQHTTKQPISVNISGGHIIGMRTLFEANTQGNDPYEGIVLNITGGKFDTFSSGECIDSNNYTGFISGGTFSKKIDKKYLKENFKLIESNGVFEVEKDTTPRGNITRVHIGEDDEGNSRIFADLSKVYFNNSVEIQLFSDEKLLTTATLNNDKDVGPGYWEDLTSSFMLVGEDDYWLQTDWTPTHDKVPTMVKLIVDEEEVASVDKIYTDSEDKGELMKPVDWYNFEGTHCNFETGTWVHDSKQHWKKCACGKENDPKEAHVFNEDGTCECGYEAVASINKTFYGILEEAINIASDNQTITILRDVDLKETLNITGYRNIVLNLNKNTVDGQILVDGSSVTINEGTLTHDGLNYDNSTLNIRSGKVTLGSDVNVQATANPNQSGTKYSTAIAVYGELEVNGSTITGNDWGIGLFESCRVTLNNATIHSGGNPISTNVGKSNKDMVVNINSGDYLCTAEKGGWEHCAIYWSSHGKLSINGGTFVTKAKDETGKLTSASLYVKNGDIHVIDGQFINSQDGIKIEAGQSNTKVNVIIDGGTFSGSRSGIYVKDGSDADANKNSSVVVNNGNFDGADSSFFTSVKNDEFIKNISVTNGIFKNNFYSWKSDSSKEIKGFVSGGTYYDKDVLKYLADGYAAEFTKHNAQDAYFVKLEEELQANAIAVIHYKEGTIAYVLDNKNLDGLKEDFVDFSTLMELVASAPSEKENYSDNSWNSFQESLEHANNILNHKLNVTQNDVTDALARLDEKIINLKEKQAPVIDVKFEGNSNQFTYGEKISGTINIYQKSKTNQFKYNQVQVFIGDKALTKVLEVRDGLANFEIDSKNLTPNNDADIELTIHYGGNGDLTSGTGSTKIRLNKADYNLEFKKEFDLSKIFDGNDVALVEGDILLDGQPVDFTNCTVTWKDKKGNLEKSPKNAGQYELVVMLKGNEFFNDKTIVHEFEITPQSLTQDMFSIDSVTYTGEKLEPKVNVPDIMTDSYTLVYSDNVNAGTGKVTVIGQNNFTGSVELQFTINKASAPKVNVPTGFTGKYSQKLSEIQLSGDWKWVDPSQTLTTSEKVYEAYITVDDANYNYEGVDGYDSNTHQVVRSIPVSVSKAESLLTVSLKDNKKDYVYEDIIEMDVSLAVDKNRSVDTNKAAVFLGDKQISESCELIEGSSVRLSIDTTEVKDILVPSENMITLTVKYGGNNDLNTGSTQVYINLKKKTTSLQFKKDTNFTRVYNGQPAALGKESIEIAGSNKDVTFIWNTPDKKAPTNAGTYKVYAEVEADNYYTSSKTEEKEYVIEKASTEVKFNKTSMVYNGKPVSLTSDDYDVTGSQGKVRVSWLDVEGKPVETPKKAGEYKVVISVEEDSNYKGVETTVPFTITSSKTNLEVKTNKSEYVYGDIIEFMIKVNPTGNASKRINVSNVVSILFNGKEIAKERISENEEKTLTVNTKELKDLSALDDDIEFTIQYTGNLDMDAQEVTKMVKINKDDSSVDITASLTKDYDSKPVSLDEKEYTVTGSKGKVSVVYLDSNDKEIDAPTDAGEYKVKVSLAADNFYKEASEIQEFAINKAANEFSEKLSVSDISFGEKPVPSVESRFGKPKYLYSNSKDGVFKSDEPSNAGKYYVKAIVEDTENYSGLESHIVSFEIKKVELPEDKKEEIIEGLDKELETLYPEGIQASVGQRLGNIQLPEGFAWKDPDMILTDTGINKISVICLLEDGNYKSFTFNIDITVNPKMENLNSIPTISAKDITLTVGDKFDPLKGVTASDKEDGDITKNIKVTLNEVDTSKSGVYLVTYEVKDSNGASYSKSITVTVKEKVNDLPDTGKDEDKKDPEKSEGENTGLSTNAGLFAGLTGISALGIALMSIFKKRKR